MVTIRDRNTQVRAMTPGADMVTGPGLGHRVIGHQVMEVGRLSDQLTGVSRVFMCPQDGARVTPVDPVLEYSHTLDLGELTEN